MSIPIIRSFVVFRILKMNRPRSVVLLFYYFDKCSVALEYTSKFGYILTIWLKWNSVKIERSFNTTFVAIDCKTTQLTSRKVNSVWKMNEEGGEKWNKLSNSTLDWQQNSITFVRRAIKIKLYGLFEFEIFCWSCFFAVLGKSLKGRKRLLWLFLLTAYVNGK